MQIRSSFKRLHATGLETPAEFRLHAKRQKALILKATANQRRASAHLNLAVAREAALLVAAIVVAIGALIGPVGQPDVVSVGFWR